MVVNGVSGRYAAHAVVPGLRLVTSVCRRQPQMVAVLAQYRRSLNHAATARAQWTARARMVGGQLAAKAVMPELKLVYSVSRQKPPMVAAHVQLHWTHKRAITAPVQSIAQAFGQTGAPAVQVVAMARGHAK